MKSTRLGSNDGDFLYPKYIHRVRSEAPEGAMEWWCNCWCNWRCTCTQCTRLVTGLGTAQLQAHTTIAIYGGKYIIRSLGTAVQHNFRRTLLVPSREDNISSLGVRYSIASGARCWCHLGRRICISSLDAAGTLLIPSREENIKRISIAWEPRYSQAHSQAKIPEVAKSCTYNEVHKAGQQQWRAPIP